MPHGIILAVCGLIFRTMLYGSTVPLHVLKGIMKLYVVLDDMNVPAILVYNDVGGQMM